MWRRFVGIAAMGGCSGLIGYAVWTEQPQFHLPMFQQEPKLSVDEVVSTAVTGATDIFVNVLQSDETLEKVSELLVQTFTHPETKENLARLFKEEFTENKETVAALKTFVVDKVIQDPWVHEELVALSIDLGKKLTENEDIWPGKTLDLLRDASLDALSREEFIDTAKHALKKGAVG